MNVKILAILSVLLVCVGCKTSAPYVSDARHSDFYNSVQEDRLLVGVDSVQPEEYNVKFEGAKLREVVDALNKLSNEYTVYLAYQDAQIEERGGRFSGGSSSSSYVSQGTNGRAGSVSGVDNMNMAPSPSASVSGSFQDTAGEALRGVSGFGSARPKEYSEILISGLFTGRIDEIVRDVSAVAGLDWERFGNKYYIGGSLRDYMISATIETSLDEKSIEKIASAYGVLIVRESNLVCITGRTKRVRAAYDLIDMMSIDVQSYNVDLVLIDVSESDLTDLRAKVEVSSIDILQEGVSVWDVFEGTGYFSLENSRAYNYVDQQLYCTDGKTVKLSIGNEVQREQRAISDAGTSTVSGYSSNNDGLTLDIMPIRSIGRCVNLALQYEDSTFGDDDLSKTTTSLDYDGMTLELGKIYYLTSVEKTRRLRSYEFFGMKNSSDRKITTIWLCVRPATAKRFKR